MGYHTLQVGSRKELKDFLSLPDLVYKDDKNYVPPFKSEVKRVLNKKKNPYFKNTSLRLFNCYKDNIICARLAIIINPVHQQIFCIKSAFFGFFESLDDNKAVKNLFKVVEHYCNENDVKVLEGPFNPNHYSELGLQINNFVQPPSFFKPYNPPYYSSLLENEGFEIVKMLHTRKNKNIKEFVSKNINCNELPLPSDCTIRSFNMKEIKKDLERIREVFNDAFSENWSFLPVSKEEYLFSAKYLKLVTKPDLIKFVEYKNNPVAVIHCVLDINPHLKKMNGKFGIVKYLKFLKERNKIDKLIIFAAGIKKQYQHTFVTQALFRATTSIVKNFKEIESTWMSKDNTRAVRAAKWLGMEPDDQLAIFRKNFH